MTLDQLTQLAHNTKISIHHINQNELLNSIQETLTFVKQIEELKLDDIKPFEHPLKPSIDLRNDIPKPSLSNEQALVNAPNKEDGFFQVPKVV